MSQTGDLIVSKIWACMPSASPGQKISFTNVRRCALAAGLLVLLLSANAQEGEELLPPLRFEGYPDAPNFDVVPRKDQLFLYPCGQCHESMESNAEIRTLDVMLHPELEHAEGRIWCLSCHGLENRNYLRTLLNEPVDFDQADQVCGGCHASRHRDWTFGAHGKRVANWQGERTLYSCAHCHNPHSPAIEPRAPRGAPPVRAGLKLKRGVELKEVPVWERQEEDEQ